jgi:hypothetical protein
MATYTPPPYFPQSSLAPADEKRYKKFKLALVAGALVVILILAGAVLGIWYLLKFVF